MKEVTSPVQISHVGNSTTYIDELINEKISAKKYALEEKLLSLKQTIYSMTGLPAEAFKMDGRGNIREGAFADIAVINLDTLEDNSTYLDPHHYAKGVNYLLVNGSIAIENGQATNNESGRTLRK